ncbi:hypothetical protein [Pseudomonas monteilii]|uniref:hypothetical protein n=1 Tax=Pseudomonas monteilii TaxID=76759 RepID=UPI003D07DF37
MSAWVDQVFASASAQNGGVVRRSRATVDEYSSLAEIIQEATDRGFHVVETGDQVVILCHTGAIQVHC